MTEQTFAASVSASQWLHAEASARFRPVRGPYGAHRRSPRSRRWRCHHRGLRRAPRLGRSGGAPCPWRHRRRAPAPVGPAGHGARDRRERARAIRGRVARGRVDSSPCRGRLCHGRRRSHEGRGRRAPGEPPGRRRGSLPPRPPGAGRRHRCPGVAEGPRPPARLGQGPCRGDGPRGRRRWRAGDQRRAERSGRPEVPSRRRRWSLLRRRARGACRRPGEGAAACRRPRWPREAT